MADEGSGGGRGGSGVKVPGVENGDHLDQGPRTAEIWTTVRSQSAHFPSPPPLPLAALQQTHAKEELRFSQQVEVFLYVTHVANEN